MRRCFGWLLLCAVCIACCFLPAISLATEPQAVAFSTDSTTTDGMIRVWLASIKSVNTYNLTINGTYSVGGKTLTNGSRVKVELSGGVVYVTMDGTRSAMGSSVEFVRQSGSLRIAEALAPSNAYPGDLSFFYSGTTSYVVCSLFLEDYVYGILPYEMDNAFPLEALKAQAVAARTYAVFSKRASNVYDVTDTTSSQTFRGVNTSKTNCIAAADATRGMVLMYGGSYIEANFGASNGGQTETRANAWNSSSVAYQQVKEDPYDLRNSRSVAKSYLIDFSREANSVSAYSMIKSALAMQLGGFSTDYSILEVVDVNAHTPRFAQPSRLYTQLRVTVRYNGGLSASVDIPIFPTVKDSLGIGINGTSNELITVTRESAGFRVTARRFGHGVGMSQRGAQQMAEEGIGYREILGFYFPNAQLVQRNFTARWGSSSVTPPPTTETRPPSVTGETTGRVALSNPNSRLNMRNSANLDGTVIARLSHGTEVTVLADVDTWYQIRHGNLTGYVAKEFISVQQTVPEQPGGKTAYITLQSGNLNVRSEGRATATVLGSVPNGTLVTVLEENVTWSKISGPGLTGYVMTQYLTMAGGSTPSPSTQTAYVSLANTRETLNLRQNPSTSAGVLKKLNHGTALTVLEKGSAWSEVMVAGITGYVMNSYVRFDGDTPPPTVTTLPPISGTTWDAVVWLSSGSLNLRSQPNTDAYVVVSIPNRASVRVTQLGDSWCAVTYNGQSGYVMRRYLSLDASTEPTATPTTPPASSAAWVVTKSGGKVNIRSTPSMSGTVAGTASHGAEVKVLEDDPSWTYVQYGVVTGYMATEYLTRTNPNQTATNPPAPVEDKYVYLRTRNGGSVNLREKPSTSAKVLDLVPHGGELLFLADEGEWTRVRYNGVTGYVASSYISQTAPVLADSGAPTGVTTPSSLMTGAVVNTGYVYLQDGSTVLTLRAQPNAQAATVASLVDGSSIEVLDYRGSTAQWVYVRCGGNEGYAPRVDCRLTYRVAQVSLESVSSTLHVRAAATDSAEIVGKLAHDAWVTVLSVDASGWASVRIEGGQSGYVATNYLKLQ